MGSGEGVCVGDGTSLANGVGVEDTGAVPHAAERRNVKATATKVRDDRYMTVPFKLKNRRILIKSLEKAEFPATVIITAPAN